MFVIDADRRKHLLDQVAAGQFNGVNHPSPETKRRAREAFATLCREDKDFAEFVATRERRPTVTWHWLFDVEVWLLRRERPIFGSGVRRRWAPPRRLASALTRRLERRGRMF